METPNLSHVTIEQVAETIEAVVAEAGTDYLYTRRPARSGSTCHYVHEGSADCIVGRVLARLGVPIEWLAAQDEFEGGLNAYVVTGFLSLPTVARDALNAAQRTQDMGRTWGVALAVFQNGVKIDLAPSSK